MPRSDGLPNPDDFIVLTIPNFYNLELSNDERYAKQQELLNEFSRELHDSLVSHSLLPSEESVEPIRYDFPPMAEGWSELFDLTIHVRPLIDDVIRATFVGGAIWKAVVRFQAWYASKNLGQQAPVVLSDSMIEMVCEFRTRQEYDLHGPLVTHSITLSPWSSKPTRAGDSTAEWHIVWIQDANRTVYQYITDAGGEILKHYVLGQSSEEISEVTLSSDRLVNAVGVIQDVSYFNSDWDVRAILQECIVIANELNIADERDWLESELRNEFPEVYAKVRFQRFEFATLIILADPGEPVYRVVTGISDPMYVSITDPEIDTSQGHRYMVQFYIGVPIEELVQGIKAVPDGSTDETPLVRMEIAAPDLPELAHLEGLEVTVLLRDGRSVVDGFEKRLREFLDRSMAAALDERAEGYA